MPTLQRQAPKSTRNNLEQQVFLELQRTADALLADIADLLKPAGLSPTQYNVLRILRGAGPEGLACGQIAVRMITRDPDITRLLDRLESRGLISRCRRTTDRRVICTRITDPGRQRVASLDHPVATAHRRQLAHLGPPKLRRLATLLEAARTRPNPKSKIQNPK